MEHLAADFSTTGQVEIESCQNATNVSYAPKIMGLVRKMRSGKFNSIIEVIYTAKNIREQIFFSLKYLGGMRPQAVARRFNSLNSFRLKLLKPLSHYVFRYC